MSTMEQTEANKELRHLLDELGNREVQVSACWRLREDRLRTDSEYARRVRERDEAVEAVVSHVRKVNRGLLEALKAVQWSYSVFAGARVCALCAATKDEGHLPECPVGAAITKAEG